MKKRVVVWGTGVVGSMVIAEILDTRRSSWSGSASPAPSARGRTSGP
ncbi:hypothetical protein [Nocardioides sp. URHA0032]|nr:hypothetical protein [Nocardioides sp. URHA0032]